MTTGPKDPPIEEDHIDIFFKHEKLVKEIQRERESYAALKHSFEGQLGGMKNEIEQLRGKVNVKSERIVNLEQALVKLVKVIEAITNDNEEGVRSWAFTTVHHDVSQMVDKPLEEARKLLSK